MTCFAFSSFGFSINFVTLLILPLIFFVKKYPYSLDGEVGLIPNINIFCSVKLDLFIFITLLKTSFFQLNGQLKKTLTLVPSEYL